MFDNKKICNVKLKFNIANIKSYGALIRKDKNSNENAQKASPPNSTLKISSLVCFVPSLCYALPATMGQSCFRCGGSSSYKERQGPHYRGALTLTGRKRQMAKYEKPAIGKRRQGKSGS